MHDADDESNESSEGKRNMQEFWYPFIFLLSISEVYF